MNALAQGWVLGKQAKPLFGIKWNTLWETPIEKLRFELNLHQVTDQTVTATKVCA